MGKYVFSQLVETKWKSVSKFPRKPRSIVDHNSKSGNLIKSSDDSVEPLEAFGYKPGVKPGSLAAAGSFCANNDNNTKTSDDSQTPSLRSSLARGTSAKTRSSRTVVTHNLRRQTKTHQDRVLQTLHRMHEENKALAAERMAAQKTMHAQKIALFGQFLDVLKAATTPSNNSNNRNNVDTS